MSIPVDIYARLEPLAGERDLQRGFAAELADPLWLLGMQWLCLEHRGSDRSSPVRIVGTVRETTLTHVDGSTDRDPSVTPLEAIVEHGPDDWWTTGRRIAIGRSVSLRAEAENRPLPDQSDLKLANLPAGYEALNDTGYDGFRLYEARAALQIPDDWFPVLPPPTPSDNWDSETFEHNFQLAAGNARLSIERHDGGEFGWYSVDATGDLRPTTTETHFRMVPARLRYPGAPHARWWEIEDHRTDIGGFPPDRSHFATLLLIELVTTHADNWFTFPVAAKSGTILTLSEVQVLDAFGDDWNLAAPDGWSMYDVQGLGPLAVPLFPGVLGDLSGPPIDEIDVGIDENANLAWAVEKRIDGRATVSDAVTIAESAQTLDGTVPPKYEYVPGNPTPNHWHPYPLQAVNGRRRLVQGQLADLSGAEVTLKPPPASQLLYSGADVRSHPFHEIRPSAIPTRGIQLERRYRLARDVKGDPVLWIQRRRQIRASWVSTDLDFDVLRVARVPETP